MTTREAKRSESAEGVEWRGPIPGGRRRMARGRGGGIDSLAVDDNELDNDGSCIIQDDDDDSDDGAVDPDMGGWGRMAGPMETHEGADDDDDNDDARDATVDWACSAAGKAEDEDGEMKEVARLRGSTNPSASNTIPL